MIRILIASACIGLTACAAAPEPAPTFALSADLSCNAGESVGPTGETHAIPISLHVPAAGGEGRFCIATGCEDAQFTPAASAQGWAARMTTNDRTSYAADLQIARDLRTFTLRQVSEEGATVWSGECSAAGS